MKVAIASLYQALTESWYSHGSGFVRIFQRQLDSAGIKAEILWTKDHRDWNDFDYIYLWQGLPLNGKLAINMFGGSCAENLRPLEKLAGFKGQIYPILHPMLPYHELEIRKWEGTPSRDLWKRLRIKYENALPVQSNPFESSWLTIGDSHAPSVWEDGSHIEVLSGKTLYGALNEGLSSLVGNTYDRVTLYFGQIDLRHHLMRQDDPPIATVKLVHEYACQVSELDCREKFVTELHPIESEDRPIPTPGRYKGHPFFGTWRQRNELRQIFNLHLHRFAREGLFKLVGYPREWVTESGMMNEAYMEKPRSVHIAPLHYRAFRDY